MILVNLEVGFLHNTVLQCVDDEFSLSLFIVKIQLQDDFVVQKQIVRVSRFAHGFQGCKVRGRLRAFAIDG